MSEFAFELRLCAHLESDYDLVARQVGASVGGGGARRVIDVLCVEGGPGLADRASLTAETIPPRAIESEAGVGTWQPVTRVFDGPPERTRRLTERAVEVGFFERRRKAGREVVRQVTRYPDWVGRLVGVENKPDLGSPGDLATQLRKDVSLGLLDRVVLATESYVTRAHRNRLPDEVGIWRVDHDREDPVEVIQEPTPLDPGGWGLQVLERRPGQCEVRPVSPDEKAAKRTAMAERAWGKGWRVDPPACARAASTGAGLPRCAHYDRVVDPARECGTGCPAHDPSDPPDVDRDALREAASAWRADPPGAARRQAGLDRFG